MREKKRITAFPDLRKKSITASRFSEIGRNTLYALSINFFDTVHQLENDFRLLGFVDTT